MSAPSSSLTSQITPIKAQVELLLSDLMEAQAEGKRRREELGEGEGRLRSLQATAWTLDGDLLTSQRRKLDLQSASRALLSSSSSLSSSAASSLSAASSADAALAAAKDKGAAELRRFISHQAKMGAFAKGVCRERNGKKAELESVARGVAGKRREVAAMRERADVVGREAEQLNLVFKVEVRENLALGKRLAGIGKGVEAAKARRVAARKKLAEAEAKLAGLKLRLEKSVRVAEGREEKEKLKREREDEARKARELKEERRKEREAENGEDSDSSSCSSSSVSSNSSVVSGSSCSE